MATNMDPRGATPPTRRGATGGWWVVAAIVVLLIVGFGWALGWGWGSRTLAPGHPATSDASGPPGTASRPGGG
jgi:hypothetical protein